MSTNTDPLRVQAEANVRAAYHNGQIKSPLGDFENYVKAEMVSLSTPVNEGMALRRDNTPPRQARDRAVYTRQQKGHSLILNLLLVGPLTLYITTIYWSVSPNHYWHA